MLLNKFKMIQSLLLVGAGAEVGAGTTEKNTRRRSKAYRLRNTDCTVE